MNKKMSEEKISQQDFEAALQANGVQVVVKALMQGMDPNMPLSDGSLPLSVALKSDSVRVIWALLALGACPNKAGHKDCCEVLAGTIHAPLYHGMHLGSPVVLNRVFDDLPRDQALEDLKFLVKKHESYALRFGVLAIDWARHVLSTSH